MKLLTKELINRFHKLGTQDVEDPIIVAKFFNPAGSETWYAISYIPDEEVIFCYMTGSWTDELGYTSLKELSELKLPLGLKIERDLYFKECKLSDIKKQ